MATTPATDTTAGAGSTTATSSTNDVAAAQKEAQQFQLKMAILTITHEMKMSGLKKQEESTRRT